MGALILRAADRFGARCTGITLSRHQHELAQERIAAAGLGERCQVLLADYRDMNGQFDRITSIGTFEHVGLKNLRGYFAKVRDLLTEDGIALNHGITSTDPDSGEVARGGGTFIHRYVFPRGELPHISLALREMSAAGLEVADVENLRRHYALTLQHWALGAALRDSGRSRSRHGRRNPLSHLEDVSRRLRLFVRPRLDVDLPDPGSQGRHPANRQAAPDSRLHLPGNLLNDPAVRVRRSAG